MERSIEITVRKTHLSGGEFLELQRIAAKHEYSQKQTKFILAMATRARKKVQNSLSIDQVTIKPEGMNFLITGK